MSLTDVLDGCLSRSENAVNHEVPFDVFGGGYIVTSYILWQRNGQDQRWRA